MSHASSIAMSNPVFVLFCFLQGGVGGVGGVGEGDRVTINITETGTNSQSACLA